MNSIALLAGLITSVIAGAPAARAQAIPQTAPPIFRSGLELVRLDVRVTDDHGRPIRDLHPEELRVEEAGRPRPILLFQHVEAPEGTYAEAAQRTIGAQVSTNQGSPRGHIYVLVFDETHILPGHEQRVRRAAQQFLRTHVRPGDRVALYALPGPGPQIGFTADVSKVVHQLTAVRGMAEQTGTGAEGALAPMRTQEAYEIVRGNQKILDRVTKEVSERLLGSDTRSSGRTRQSAAAAVDNPEDNRRVLVEDARMLVARADDESRRFLRSLADIVRGLTAVDGRKAVILFSEGFQIDNVTHELVEVAAAAAQSYSVIYAMDLNSRAIEADAETPRGGEQSTEILDKLQALGTLTSATAGTLVLDASSHIDSALSDIAATSEDYYLVGFEPADRGQGDRGRYRRIHVSVTRPGARVSARTGYSLRPRVTPADRRREIDAALRAPFAQEGLAVEYTTYAVRGSRPGVQRVVLSLAANLPLASAAARTADVVYVVRDVASGKVAASGSGNVVLPAEPAAPGATTGTGLYRVQFPLPAGTYLMRAVVREPGGLLGSADRRFEVHAKGGPDVTASDLVLGSSDVEGLPVRPTAYISDVLTGVFELYGGSAAQLEYVSATADLLPVGGGSAAVSVAADLAPVAEDDGGPRRAARIDLPLADVTPGRYLVRVTIRRGRDTVAEILRDVAVRAGTRPAPAPPAPAVFNPRDVLDGEIARQLIARVNARTRGGAVGQAAAAAALGHWADVDAALTAAPVGSADAAILESLAAFARADYAAAATALRAAQRTGGRDPALAFVLGWAHAAGGDDRAAITAWRTAVVADATLVPPYLALADAYVRLGQPGLARQVLNSGLDALPRSPELLNRLARLQDR